MHLTDEERNSQLDSIQRQIKMLTVLARVDTMSIYEELVQVDPEQKLSQWDVARKIVDFLRQDFN